jgi:hypothetical protein
MTKRLLSLGWVSVLALASLGAQAQASLTTSPYTQNFDGLANTGASNAKSTLPTGWDFTETGTSALADNLYAADNGAGNGGNVYSYGATSGTDRALGSLRSGSLAAVIGARFTNATGAALPSLMLAYNGETWRVGGTNRSDKMAFEYSLDATSLSTGTWTAVTALDYTNNSATATSTAGVTAPVQTTAVTGTIASLNLANGATIWFRWTDTDASGADDGMAIDDISLSWGVANPTTPTLTASVTSLTFGGQNIGTTSAAQTYTLTGANLTGATTLTATGPFTISKDNTTFGTTLSYAVADLATAQTVYVKFAPTVTGTTTGTITAASAGATTTTVALTGTGADPSQTTFNFNTCATALSDGWSQYSVTGAQVWACTTFGRDPNAPAGTAAAPYGVQINGYASGNQPNEDWFISPAFDLSTYTYPLFSFWSRTAFTGPGLKLRVSTNYSGTGAPSAATWTDVNAAFPGAGSDTWTQTANVNLSAFKGPKVYVAFVYTSTTTGAARWTLDDIAITNSATPPAPTVQSDVKQLAFGYQAVGTSGNQTFNVSGADLTGNVTLTSSNANFTLSKDGTTFASTITLTQAELSGTSKAITVRFSPTTALTSYNGTIAVSTTGAAAALSVAVSGDTYDPTKTLEVVNWNMEWFGSADATLGPTDKNLQNTNATTVLNFLKADVYALEEVVDTVRLKAIAGQLSTTLGVPYAYKISDYGSYADNAQDPDYVGDQKLTFIYRTDIVKNPSFMGLLRCTQADNCAAYTPWASGRFPFLMRADVTLDGITKKINFIVIHAKANATATSANDYARRKAGADQLKALIEANYPNDPTLIVGDYNDVLDGTIATGVTPAISSYSSFTQDPNYLSITLPLAQAGQRSTASYATVIDNVIANKNMAPYYIRGTAAIRTDAAALITNYANTTSDHYPVFSRYSFTATPLATKASRTASLGLYPNPVANSVRFEVPETGKDLSLQVFTTTGRLVLQGKGSVEQLNQQLSQRVGGLSAGLYVVRVIGAQQTYTDRFEKQ